MCSSWEQLRGPAVEFDRNRLQIVIQQNVGSAYQGYQLPKSMMDTLNMYPLWGFNPRQVKLSSFKFDRKLYGSCFVYYPRTLTFDIRDNGFDGNILDEGTKVLSGHWNTAGHWVLDKINGQDPDPMDPSHFIRFQDRNGNTSRVILNGRGLPATAMIGTGTGTAVLSAYASVTSIDSTSGAITGVRLDFMGYGYTQPNGTQIDVTVLQDPNDVFELGGREARITATVNNGFVESINILDGGSGYVGPTYGNFTLPTLIIPPPTPPPYPMSQYAGGPGRINVQAYDESDFLQLGIPSSF